MARPRYYITTPIYYATAEPHIGHAYCTIAADVAARYRRMTGHDVFFLTGTDEHGQKMEREAAARGLAPRQLADQVAPRYRELWSKLGISNDDFVRTTEPRHRKAVHEMWRRMAEKGDIYRGAYEGLYCVSCEAFYLEKDLVDGRCPDHGTVPERTKEEGYFFRLSAYAPRLLEHYREHPEFVAPETRRNEVVSFVSGGLRDLSISRATTRWGLEVPGDPEHVIYVWVDALTNYLTGIGFPDDGESLQRWWPASVHLAGKEILRFHAVYWPAFLMSAGIELPRQIFGHGWWLRDGKKISKSASDTIHVEPIVERFGADALRYFLLREVPFGLDGSFSDEAFLGRYNSDLANDFGNLVQRTLQVVFRFGEGRIPPRPSVLPEAVTTLAAEAIAAWRGHFDQLAFSRGIEAVWELVRTGNRYVDERAPWAIARDPGRREELETVLYTSAEIVRLLTVLLHPVMPEKTRVARHSLGLSDAPPTADELGFGLLAPGVAIAGFEPLFPRIDAKEWLGAAPVAAAAGAASGRPVGAATATAPQDAGKAVEKAAAAPPANAAEKTPAAATTAPASTPAAAEEIRIDEFFRADLRVAKVRSAERVPKSKKLIKLIVDLGDEQRQVVAGIGEKYAPEQLVGKNMILVANLKPAKLMGVESRGMLLAASIDGLPVIATFEEDVPPGTKVK